MLLFIARPAVAEWPTFGGDSQRTGWARGETILNKENASTLELKWKIKLDNVPKGLTSLTAPVVADQVKTAHGLKEYVIVAGSSDAIYAVDADTGKLAWQRKFSNNVTPNRAPDPYCPFALNATPAIQGRRPKTIYAITSDGNLHALSAVDGEDCMAPKPFVPAFSKNWSLNITDGILYTTISQRCNGVLSGVYSLDLEHPDDPIRSFQVGRPGIWGRGGVTVSAKTHSVFVETGDGVYSPEAGSWADSFLALSAKELQLSDYYTPANREWITRKDLDMGNTSPVVFDLNGKEYLAGAGKEGRIYLLDTSDLGNDTHRKPAYRSDLLANEEVSFSGSGFWGAFATWEGPQKTRWLFAPAWGPPHSAALPLFPLSHGDASHGSIMSFHVETKDGVPTLSPTWISRDLSVPEPPVVANGVLFALSSGEDVRQADVKGNTMGAADRVRGSHNAVLYALDAETGKELFSSGETISSFTHFSGLAISNGRVFVTAWDGTVYAFGIKNEER